MNDKELDKIVGRIDYHNTKLLSLQNEVTQTRAYINADIELLIKEAKRRKKQ